MSRFRTDVAHFYTIEVVNPNCLQLNKLWREMRLTTIY